MLSRPQTTLLAFLALSSFAQASWVDGTVDEIARRQVGGDVIDSRTSSEPTVLTTSSPEPTIKTESSSTSAEPTTTDPPRSTTTTPVNTPTESSTTTSSSTSTTSSSTTESSTTTSSSTLQSTTSTTPTPSKTTPLTTPSPTVIRVTRTETVDGQVRTSVSESTSTIPPTATDPASLSQSNETNGDGMSAKTRSTIIGVVVGIGGAVLLGGLAVVAYRIWGRKKERDDADEFMSYNRPDNALEKAGGSSGSGSSNPFKSTLESYHNPAKVNASSNF